MITLIFAHAQNGVIGRDGALPWHLPADLRHFKALTIGKPMLMGRKTFESFPAPLPERRHIVLTRDPAWRADGAEVVHDVEAALATAGDDVSIIGGAEIFRLFEDRADRAEVTTIWRDYQGDARYALDPSRWVEHHREPFAAEGDRPAFTFFRYARADAKPLAPVASPSYSARSWSGSTAARCSPSVCAAASWHSEILTASIWGIRRSSAA